MIVKPSDPDLSRYGSLMRLAANAAVATGLFMLFIKALAFVVTNSIAMLASMADSALDVFGSFINLLAVRQALTPADREHRFGHGKAEPLAGLAQGAFISGSAIFLVVQGVQRLIDPRPIEHGALGLAVMVVSIVAALALVMLQRHVVRRTGSIAINADFMHYLADIVINAGVVVAILLATRLGMPLADPVVGILVAGVLAFGVVRIVRQSYDQLMDRELPNADRDRIKAIVMRHPAVFDMHDLRTRAAGARTFIQVHIELDPTLSLFRAHSISDEVEAEIRAAFPLAEIIIHQDPEGYEQPEPLAKS